MISVIMGVFNAVDTIRKSLESIKEQTVRDIELIVCDDCSTDGTWELLQTIKDEYRINVLLRNEVNCGLAYSLNRCIEYSHGEFIARMDADDWCKPERLEKQLNFLRNHEEYDLVGTLCMFVYDDGTEHRFEKPEIPTKDILPLTNPFIHPTILIRRTSMDKLGWYTVSKHTLRCEDLDLWYRFFYLRMNGYNIQEFLYYKKQGLDNYKKRKIKYGIDIFVVHVKGIKLLNMKWYKYILAFKPIFSSMVSKRMMMFYHKLIYKI